jgi:hypothetical protein
MKFQHNISFSSFALFILYLVFFSIPSQAFAFKAEKTELVLVRWVPTIKLNSILLTYPELEWDDQTINGLSQIPVFIKLQKVQAKISLLNIYRWHETQIHLPVKHPKYGRGYIIPYLRTDSAPMDILFSTFYKNTIISGDSFSPFTYPTHLHLFSDKDLHGNLMLSAQITFDQNIGPSQSPFSSEQINLLRRWLEGPIFTVNKWNKLKCIPVANDYKRGHLIALQHVKLITGAQFDFDLFSTKFGPNQLSEFNQTDFSSQHNPDGAFLWQVNAIMSPETDCHLK